MNEMDLAKAIFGKDDKTSPNTPSVQFGTAVSNSVDGTVSVIVDGETVNQVYEDDDGNPVEDAHVDLPCEPNVQSGDVVRITTVNGAPTVSGVVGGGDRTYDVAASAADAAASAQASADAAQNSANAAAAAAGAAQTSADDAATAAASAQADATAAGTAAAQAISDAATAQGAADAAQADATAAGTAASVAQASADAAQQSATNANEYASRALGNLSTVQSVAETLAWVSEHGTMTHTTDTAPDPTHVYFVADPDGDYTVGGATYSLVAEPDAADLGSYFELSIDESLNNYVGTHLALTDDGLWLLPAATGTYKVLVSTGAGSTYTTPGTYIIDGTGGTIAAFTGDGISFGSGTAFTIGDESAYIHFDGDGHINIGGTGITIGGSVSLADLLRKYDSTITADDISVTKTGTTATITVGSETVTISDGAKGDTGATGPQGPQGETGPQGPQGETGATGAAGGRWYSGTKITGTSTTAKVFSGSGITAAVVGDMYLNTSTCYTYRCTVAGNASTAKWAYVNGIKGATGSQGPQGETGPQGPQGIQGETGATGATGPQGPQGEQGKTGPQGAKGDKGDKGDTGDTGAQGVSVSSVVHQYYLSTSSSSQAGGSWTVTPADYVTGRYYWERWLITFSDNSTAYTEATLAKEVTSAWTAIESNSEQIALRATKTEVEQAIDAIEVGGRNLLRETEALSDSTWWERAGITSITDGQTDPEGGSGAVLIEPSKSSWYLISRYHYSLITNVGETYTASIWLKAEAETTCKICVRYLESEYSDSNHTTRMTVNLTTSWQRFSVTGTLHAAQTSDCFWIGQASTVNVYAYHPKLERGNKPTDWTPAPEDMASGSDLTAAISQEVTDRNSAIEQSAESITSSVSATYATKTEVGQKADSSTVTALSTRVTQTEADVTTAITGVNGLNALVRQYGQGVLVCRQGNTIGALVNADGSFDIVSVTWDGATPTAGTVLTSFGADGSRVGRDDGVHSLQSASAFKLLDRNATEFTSMELENDEETGLVLISYQCTTDGSTKAFTVRSDIVSLESVRKNGTVLVEGTDYTVSGRTVTLSVAPTASDDVWINYRTDEPAPAFTFGTRAAGAAVGQYSIAEGSSVESSDLATHAEGMGTHAGNACAHAEGFQSSASGECAHAEGNSTQASGENAHAEGNHSKATGLYSHSEGGGTEASGKCAHAEGYTTEASGICAHSEGHSTVASGNQAHATGLGTIASGNAQMVLGKFNAADANKALIIGNGTSDTARSNALTVDWDGSVRGNVKVLYDNTTGTTGTVTLSATAANYNHMRIYFRTSWGGRASVDVYAPNGKSVALNISEIHDWQTASVMYVTRVCAISGKSITRSYEYGLSRSFASGAMQGYSDSNYIYIIRVEGWNE